MLDVTDAFIDFMEDYSRVRYTIENTFEGEKRVGTSATISAYIHPDDYEKDVYNQQGQRLEDRIKIFCFLDADIKVNDEIDYEGETYKVTSNNVKRVGSYKKLLAEMVRK